MENYGIFLKNSCFNSVIELNCVFLHHENNI